MKLLRYLRQLFWQWIPHRCRFTAAKLRPDVSGYRCWRCGTAVWIGVRADEGGIDRG